MVTRGSYCVAISIRRFGRLSALPRNAAKFSLSFLCRLVSTRPSALLPVLSVSSTNAVANARMGSFTSAPKILNDDNQDSDICLPDNISRQDLLNYCNINLPKLHPMIKRNFRRTSSTESLFRKYRKFDATFNDSNTFSHNPYNVRVFQWNVLSQALGKMNDNFARCPDEALDWNYRRFRIVEEIMEYTPDIVCLQEVDHYNFLKHVLETQGYSGVFFPKPDSPCVYIQGNNGPDGCAIFYRKSKFEIVNFESKILEVWKVQCNQVALLAILRVRDTNQELCIVTTHLKARNGALLSTLRNEQGKDLLEFLSNHSGNRPSIMCGDFNAEPNEPIYNTVLNCKHLGLSSAYADSVISDLSSAAREPPYTTWKIRDEGEICHTIDYIFYTKSNMAVEKVLELPTGDEIGIDRVPSFTYPSDHFSLVCDFRLNNSSSPHL